MDNYTALSNNCNLSSTAQAAGSSASTGR
jgi:hypothetical protein